MRWLRAGVGAALTAVLLWAGFRFTGPLPPLGTLLDPVRGAWALARQPDVPRAILIPSLTDSVTVVVDDRMVPHIFAENTADAWRALGYVHAYHRLFQMELQWRAAAGRLSEWRPDLVEVDRRTRAIGLAWSAERDLARMDTTDVVGRALAAYAQGVNARIAELTPAELPLEYRLLGVRPTAWAPIHSILFSKRMGQTLTYETSDLAFERLVAQYGNEVANGLSPIHAPIQEPIVPTRWAQPRVWEGWRLPWTRRHVDTLTRVSASTRPRVHASNNWVVHGSRTASGNPLLAGDPHLDLSLPSIWFEAHVVVRDALDVYGVTFPGAPGVVIGFNRDVAWSFTNTGADVLDFYDEVLDDDAAPTAYRVDETWRRLERRVEVYRNPAGDVIAEDTLYYTHRGPIRREEGKVRSMAWTVLDELGFFQAIEAMGRAGSVVEWLEAARLIHAPAQNGVVADRMGDIAIISAGTVPIRPGGGDGRRILDGTRSTSDWLDAIPVSNWPYARNPAQGYLASANQEPMDPRADPIYLGSNWPTPWRAMRINALLRADTAVTPEAMERYQTDPGSARADWFVPHFVRAGGRSGSAGDLLSRWDRRYTLDNEGAVLFEAAMRELRRRAWDELVEDDRWLWNPNEALLAVLLRDSTHTWWDDRATEAIEDRDVILTASLAAALDTVIARYGPQEDGGWRWERVNYANIWHLLRLPALSVRGIPVQGGSGLLNPISGSGTHGPSWRMVVDLSTPVRAWATYPGGQSGNPFSLRYADRIRGWAVGQLEEVRVPRAPDDFLVGRVLGTIHLTRGTP